MRNLVAVLVALALLGAGCGDGDADAAPVPTSVGVTDTVDELESVFPVPSGEVTVVSPYAEVADETLCTETVVFSVAGPGADAVMEYYDRLLTNMGYVVDEVDVGEANGAHAFEISDPANDGFTGAIKVDSDAGNEGTVRVYQERNRLKG